MFIRFGSRTVGLTNIASVEWGPGDGSAKVETTDGRTVLVEEPADAHRLAAVLARLEEETLGPATVGSLAEPSGDAAESSWA